MKRNIPLPVNAGFSTLLLKRNPFSRFLFLLFFSVISLHLYAQQGVTGRVTAGNSPIEGATVQVKGSTSGTQTDANGRFSLSAPSNATLVISYIGHQTQEVKISNRSSLAINMEVVAQDLENIVVVGYGTQKRTMVTGAVSSVGGKTINEVPAVNISSALQGRIAGVTVTSNGSPGASPIVRIRGISSISFASDPLYVVDGFPTGDLATIDTSDIESVDVLKDASAAAIYGSRATNGVVMITTKKGRRDGKMKVSLDSYYGISKVTARLDLFDREGFMQYALAYRGSQVPRLLPPDANMPVYAGATQTYGQTNTDWQDAYFKDGSMTQHNIGLSGGNGISRFYASAGFMDQRGTTPSVGYRRYNFRINSDHAISKTLPSVKICISHRATRIMITMKQVPVLTW